MIEEIFSLSFAGRFLILIPLMIWVMSLIGWMIQDEIDVLFGIAGIFIGLGLAIVCFAPTDDRLSTLALLVAFTTILVFPIVRKMANARALAKIDIETMERAYERLSFYPTDTGARVRVAKALQARGVTGPAVRIVEESIKNLPKTIVKEELAMVRQWRARTSPRDFEPISCFQCGAQNHLGDVYCQRCNAPYLLGYARGQVVGADFARKIIGTWIAAVLAIVGIPMVSMSLPRPTSMVAVTLLLLFVAAVAAFSFWPRKRTA